MNILESKGVRRFLLVFISVVFVLFCIEFPALVEVVDYRTLIGPYHAWWGHNVADAELLAVHRPYARASGSARGGDAASGYKIPPSDMTSFQWDLKYDHNGFRNLTDLKSADIVVIGDSIVEGLTVTNSQLMTTRLAQLQGKVVANLGHSTYGPLQELIVLKRYGLALRPRTVLWVFFEGNDLGDVIAFQEARQHPQTFWRAFWARSFTRNARLELKYLLAPPVRAPGITRSGVFQASDGRRTAVYFVHHPQPFSKDYLTALSETADTLKTAHELCEAQRARLIFVFVPMKFRVFQPFCQFPAESECRNWVLTDLPERLKSAVATISGNIGYLDLTPALVDVARKGEFPYYPDDEHWTPEGQKIAAEVINEYLTSSGSR